MDGTARDLGWHRVPVRKDLRPTNNEVAASKIGRFRFTIALFLFFYVCVFFLPLPPRVLMRWLLALQAKSPGHPTADNTPKNIFILKSQLPSGKRWEQMGISEQSPPSRDGSNPRSKMAQPVMDCAGKVCRDGAFPRRAQAKSTRHKAAQSGGSFSPFPPSSIFNLLSSVFILASILPPRKLKSVIHGRFDTIFFLKGFLTRFGANAKNAELATGPYSLTETRVLGQFTKTAKKTAFFEGSKKVFL